MMVALSAILYGGITAGGNFLLGVGLSVYEVSIYSLVIILVLLLPPLALRRDLFIKREYSLFYLIYGLIGASLQLSSFLALFLGVPVAIVAMLINTQPVWTTIIGRTFLGEAVNKRQMLAMAIALIGVVILLEPWTARQLGQMTGILFSLAAGFLLSLWIIWGRRGGLNIQHSVTITFGFAASTLTMLLLFYPLVKLFSTDEKIIRLSFDLPASQWYFLIIFVLIANLTPHLLFFTGIRSVKAVTAGILLLLEPLSAAILAVIIFGQPLTPFMILGGSIILASNYFIIKKGRE